MNLEILGRVLLRCTHEYLLAPHLAAEIARQRDTVVERMALGRDHHDRCVGIRLAQVLSGGFFVRFLYLGRLLVEGDHEPLFVGAVELPERFNDRGFQRVGFLLGKLGRTHPKLEEWRRELQRGGSVRLVASSPYAETYSAEWNLSLP